MPMLLPQLSLVRAEDLLCRDANDYRRCLVREIKDGIGKGGAPDMLIKGHLKDIWL